MFSATNQFTVKWKAFVQKAFENRAFVWPSIELNPVDFGSEAFIYTAILFFFVDKIQFVFIAILNTDKK